MARFHAVDVENPGGAGVLIEYAKLPTTPPSIETLDLFELFGWVGKMKDNDAAAIFAGSLDFVRSHSHAGKE
jgi:hypothetical protein